MIYLTFDAETYYDDEYSLRKMATSTYVRDPRFVCMGAAVKVNQEPTRWLESEEIAPFLKSLEGNKVALIGHNLTFDGTLLSLVYGFVPDLYLDTMGMARAIIGGASSGHSLDAVAEYLGIGSKIKGTLGNMKGRGLEVRQEDPQLWADYVAYGIQDVDLTYDIFMRLIKDFPKQEQLSQDVTIRMHTQPILELDEDLCEQLVKEEEHKDATAYDNLVEMFARHGLDKPTKTAINSNGQFAELLKARGVEPPTKVSPATGLDTWAFAKNDEEFTLLEHHPDEVVRQLYDTRMRLKSRISLTRAQRFHELSSEGPLCLPLSYCGATATGRWSGTGAINPQNLPRTGQLRNTIRAPSGHKLVILDLSGIELRCVLAIAGEWEAIENIKNGADLYFELARVIFGSHLDTKENYPNERQAGKVATLSCGYKLGNNQALRKYGLGMGADLNLDVCQQSIDGYRRAYPRVVQLWKTIDEALKFIEQNQHTGDDTEYNFPGLPSFLRVSSKGIHLPSGLAVKYPDLQKTVGYDSAGEPYRWPSGGIKKQLTCTENRRGMKNGRSSGLHGGSVTGHVTQAVARSILSEQMVEISRRWKVCLSVHDEIVLCVPEEMAQEAYDDMLEVMTRPLKWWPELPLDAEGGIYDHYVK